MSIKKERSYNLRHRPKIPDEGVGDSILQTNATKSSSPSERGGGGEGETEEAADAAKHYNAG
jgi:hypothetical protein